MAERTYDITDLVDLTRLQRLMDQFSQATAIPVGLVDQTGRYLVRSGWQDLCTVFHHCNPAARKRCQQNEENIITHLCAGEYSTFRCQNGLREIAVPVTIEGQQAATMFLGQFLFDDDKLYTDSIIEQAGCFGFDATEYLDAWERVPVYSHEKVSHIIDFYLGLIALTTDMGMSAARLRASEHALQNREEEYHQLVEHVNAIILRIDTAGRITFINEYGQKFFGFSPDELLGHSVVGTILPKQDSTGRSLDEMIEEILSRPECHITNENENITKNGDRVWIYWNNRPTYDNEHNLTEILCVGTDVTERREIYEALRKNESRLLAAQRMARMGSYEFVLPDGESIWSPEIFDILKLDPSQASFTMQQAFTLVHPDDLSKAEAAFNDAVQHQSQLEVNFRLVPPGHDPVYVRTVGQVTPVSRNGPLIMFGVMMDITESKLAEQRITASLEEKEVLLREIHHRVKNNFQIISSLLTLQADNIPDNEKRVLFDTAINRIRAMALIHEHLYRSSNLANIPADEYLSRICQNIRRVERPAGQVTLSASIGPLTLPIDNAIYFGLIVNELVTNAYRHGVTGVDTGTINLSMNDENGEYHLFISDTGSGFPDGFDWRHDGSLGLRLVETLVERQLNGTVELTDPTRAAFHITFPNITNTDIRFQALDST